MNTTSPEQWVVISVFSLYQTSCGPKVVIIPLYWGYTVS
jgi:hypothetical protein